MKKLEEILNLPDVEEDNSEEFSVEIPEEDETDVYYMDELEDMLSEVDKIDQSLGAVRGLELLDSEMDELAKKSMETFEKLVKMGEQVDDRNVAPIYDAASKLMSNAITAKQSKMDRKLKAIQLQIQKAKVDHENRKLDQKIKERRERGDDAIPINGDSQKIEINRTELLRQIIENNNKNDK